ncbi:MAG: fructosamine kinase family protein [Saprospiraceae bacterium]|nr:fructosamine kinase family protein [Saprospiraceae bacterium]
MLPLAILENCQTKLGETILATRPISGGDINEAYQLSTASSQYFLKINTAPFAKELFVAEAAGLHAIATQGILRTPTVIGHDSTEYGSFLLLEFIESGYRPDGFWECFGAAMANLHRKTAPSFGFENDNFIGVLPQPNGLHGTWPDFYIAERLLPQLSIAEQGKKLQPTDFQNFEQLFKKLPELCPNEPPAFVHGDFWSGNFLCDANGSPVLIDPAVSFSHREMDLAMSRLFGGFDRLFYQAYETEWPLAPGFEGRLPVYQLYYLLVHVNLFGGGYVQLVRDALRQFV